MKNEKCFLIFHSPFFILHSSLTSPEPGDYDLGLTTLDATTTRHISLATIRAAAEGVYEAAVRTPLVALPTAAGSPQIYLKLETLQPIGSFKIRGAYNAVRHLTADQLAGGVWTVSAGNAAQGVALAAKKRGAACSVMVMDTAPRTKLDAIERLGATIVQAPYEECWRTVERHGSDRMPGHFVHPFDDDLFISGNGTIGLEIVDDLPDVDAVIAPIGGGGLLAGIACALHTLRPEAVVYAAEPETAAPLAASFHAGHASYFDGWKASFVDGAGGRSVLPGMWPLLRQWVAESIVVSLDDVAAAMKTVAERVHVIAEGAAACAVAAALSPAMAARGHRKVLAVVSGGNIDLARFAQLVGACEPKSEV
jgi:threonine dehydratase